MEGLKGITFMSMRMNGVEYDVGSALNCDITVIQTCDRVCNISTNTCETGIYINNKSNRLTWITWCIGTTSFKLLKSRDIIFD